jgi:hypothetical protein
VIHPAGLGFMMMNSRFASTSDAGGVRRNTDHHLLLTAEPPLADRRLLARVPLGDPAVAVLILFTASAGARLISTDRDSFLPLRDHQLYFAISITVSDVSLTATA